MILNFSNNFSNSLNLQNFLDNYGIDRNRFYSRYSFYKLLFETENKNEYKVKHGKRLDQSLRRFSRIDSKRLLNFSERVLKEKIDISSLDKQEKIMLGMFHYAIWGNKPEISYKESLNDLKNDNPDIVIELLDIIDYNRGRIKAIEIEYEDQDVPLDIYASYTTDQIMVAFEKTGEDNKYPMWQGALYIEDKHTDLFFITINKNEEDYLPSTMYNDYAKSKDLFNWESQSTIGVNTPTGQRYIYDRTNEHKVLLFVRESNQEYNQAAPYIFLGNARYFSHKGSNPIQIVWKMEHQIPERIIRESNLRVVK